MQKRKPAKIDVEKDFIGSISNAIYGKTMENVRNRLNINSIKKVDVVEIFKQQSKLIFNGIHKAYANCSCYTFEQNEVQMD